MAIFLDVKEPMMCDDSYHRLAWVFLDVHPAWIGIMKRYEQQSFGRGESPAQLPLSDLRALQYPMY